MTEQQIAYRILDASANRAAEGLRTLEEYARFGLDDADQSTNWKGLRHELQGLLLRFPRDLMLSARDTEADVGTEIGEKSEYVRSDILSVVQAAASRVQQSLRVLEEYGKVIDAEVARGIEQVRYRCYTLSAKLELSARRCECRQRLSKSLLYVLVDAAESNEAFEANVRMLIQAGADVLQLRDRTVDDRTLIERAAVGTAIARENEGLFIMNDRADLALAADTDGVHVGQEELPVSFARQIVGQDRLVGVSTHSLDQAIAAVADGADYIGCGPVFAGNTKQFDRYVGTELLSEVSTNVDIPAFAIGGIDLTNLEQVVSAGMRRVAVTGAVRDAADPADATARLKAILADPSADPTDDR